MIRQLTKFISILFGASLISFGQTSTPYCVTNLTQLVALNPGAYRLAFLLSDTAGGGVIYRYKNDATDATNATAILKPLAANGRWIKQAGPKTSISVADFGAVGDYTGGLQYDGTTNTVGSGTDSRAAIQAALDYAYTQGPGGYSDLYNGASFRVVVPKGKYYISARSDGLRSLFVPSKVELDLSEAEIYLDRPPTNDFGHGILEPNPLWCGILVGSRGRLIPGQIAMRPNQDLTYGGTWFGSSLDAVRVQESDISWMSGGGLQGTITGFTRGAGIRYLACYNAFTYNLQFSSCAFGVVMSYFGSAYTNYTRYRPNDDADSVSTSLWVDNCSFLNIFEKAVLIGVNGDYHTPAGGGFEVSSFDRSVNGGPISISHCAFENIGHGAIHAFTQGTVFIDDIRMEECDALNTSLAVIYASTCRSFKLSGVQWEGFGTRSILKGSYMGPLASSLVNPLVFCRVDAVNCSPLLQNIYANNQANLLCQLVNGNTNQTRFPTIIDYRAETASQMQGTNSYLPIAPPNDGGRIYSASTTGLKPVETVNGSTTNFTFVNGATRQIPSRVQIDGGMWNGTNSNGTVNWSWDSTNTRIQITPAPTKDVRAFF